MSSRHLRRISSTVLALMFVPLAATAGDVADLSLDDLLNTRVTTASKFSQRASEAPSSVSVIHGEEIRRHGWHSLHEALASVRGMWVSVATDYHYLGVRGFSLPGDYNSRVLLLIDGIPTNDGVYDQAKIGPDLPLDMSLIERIEVVPGPGSALYGGNAYLAVINVITRDSDSVGRSVTLGAGSDGLLHAQASAGGRDPDGRHWLVAASSERSNGPARPFPQWNGVGGSDGWARDMDGERVRRLFLRYGGGDWSLHLAHGERRKEAAGGMFASDFDAPGHNLDATTQIALRVERTLNETWALEGQAYTGHYLWEGRYRFGGTWETDKADSYWAGANAQLTGKLWRNQTWVLGASVRNDFRRDQVNVGEVLKGRRTITSLYAQDDIRFNDVVALNLGARYDRDTLGSRQFSPRGALVFNLPAAIVLKLMSGRAFRPPNAYESIYTYPGLQLAGGTLKPELITTREIALEQAIGSRGRWTASVYRNRFRDLLGNVTDFTTNLQQFQTVGDARTEGLELGARYRFDTGVDMRGSLAWQHSADGAGAPLPNSPRQLAKLLASVPFGGYEFAWETYYTGARQDIFGGRVGGQMVSHAALSGRFSRDWRWLARVSNLFDRRLATVVGGEYSVGAAGNVPTIEDYRRRFQAQMTVDF